MIDCKYMLHYIRKHTIDCQNHLHNENFQLQNFLPGFNTKKKDLKSIKKDATVKDKQVSVCPRLQYLVL